MLAELLKERMRALGINQAELAKRSALSPQYVSDLVNNKGAGRISVATQHKLARGMRVSPSRVAACVATPENISAVAEPRRASASV